MSTPGYIEDGTPTATVRVYHLHRGRHRDDPRAQAADNLRHDIRFHEATAGPSQSEFVRLYEHQGTDEMPDRDILSRVWNVWNGPVSPEPSAYEPSEMRSLEVADVVAVGTQAYVVHPLGWERVENLDDAITAEVEQ